MCSSAAACFARIPLRETKALPTIHAPRHSIAENCLLHPLLAAKPFARRACEAQLRTGPVLHLRARHMPSDQGLAVGYMQPTLRPPALRQCYCPQGRNLCRTWALRASPSRLKDTDRAVLWLPCQLKPAATAP